MQGSWLLCMSRVILPRQFYLQSQWGLSAMALKETRMRAGGGGLATTGVVSFPKIWPGRGGPPPQGATATYVGSTACKTCHPAMYQRWSKTRMANVVTDPKTHPEVILPDLAKADP